MLGERQRGLAAGEQETWTALRVPTEAVRGGTPDLRAAQTVSGVAAAAGDPEEGGVGRQLLEARRELMATPRPDLFRDGAAGDRSWVHVKFVTLAAQSATCDLDAACGFSEAARVVTVSPCHMLPALGPRCQWPWAPCVVRRLLCWTLSLSVFCF